MHPVRAYRSYRIFRLPTCNEFAGGSAWEEYAVPLGNTVRWSDASGSGQAWHRPSRGSRAAVHDDIGHNPSRFLVAIWLAGVGRVGRRSPGGSTGRSVQVRHGGGLAVMAHRPDSGAKFSGCRWRCGARDPWVHRASTVATTRATNKRWEVAGGPSGSPGSSTAT